MKSIDTLWSIGNCDNVNRDWWSLSQVRNITGFRQLPVYVIMITKKKNLRSSAPVECTGDPYGCTVYTFNGYVNIRKIMILLSGLGDTGLLDKIFWLDRSNK